ncbi:MAG: hypothetical protein SNJ58_14680 [Aggregatilineales bacterium]
MSEEVVLCQRISAPLQLNIGYIGGDLLLEGSPSDELLISGDGVQIERPADGVLRLEGDAGCHVRVPRMVSVRVEAVNGDLRAADLVNSLSIGQCHADLTVRTLGARLDVQNIAGDARIADVDGDVHIGSVGADLILRGIDGSVRIEQVGADLDVKRVSGACLVRRVGANACLKDVRGALSLEQVGSDAVLTDVLGNCAIEQVGADLVLDMSFASDERYEFGAIGADLVVKIRTGEAVVFHVPSEAEKIINVRNVQLEHGTKTDTICVGKPGHKCAEVTIKALGGTFELIGRSRGFSSTFEFSIPDNLGEIISSQISQQLSRLEQTLSGQAERFSQRAEEAIQRTARRKGRDKSVARAWTWSGEVNIPLPKPLRQSFTPRAEPPPVTQAERMAILRMVEERKITIEEAERLLAALEGRE